MDGVKTEMISAKMFSYKNVKWRSIRNSRFSKVAKVSDISNLNIQIQIKPQLLSPEIMYGAYLVFKFCNPRKVSSRPLYVNLKYKKAGETLTAYFAEWMAGREWLRVELFRFLNKETIDCDVLLESFSRYYCGSWGIFIEGIEFNVIPNIQYKENKKLNDEQNIHNASKEELYPLLFNGILIDKGEKMFSLSKVNGKKCHMLPARSVISGPSNVNFYKIKPEGQPRFTESVEILSFHEFRIKCDVETQLLSSNTSYACFLVFKLSKKYCHGLNCPVKARDLLPCSKERTNIISFMNLSTVNSNKIKWIPEQRKDGWMEVKVWEIKFDQTQNDDSIPMDLKLINFVGTMFGLIICGIEFRPM